MEPADQGPDVLVEDVGSWSGHLRVKTDDGSQQDIRAGDAYNVPPGPDGWVVGDGTFLSVE